MQNQENKFNGLIKQLMNIIGHQMQKELALEKIKNISLDHKLLFSTMELV